MVSALATLQLDSAPRRRHRRAEPLAKGEELPHCHRWRDHLIAHLPIAREGVDPEGVHQVRVGSARLRVWLELGGHQVLRDDLKWLRDHAAEVRDLDVHLERSPPEPIAAHLERRKAEAQLGLVDAIDHPRVDGLLQALAVLPPISRGPARRQAGAIAHTALVRGGKAMRDAEDLEALHSMRIAVRRTRYALEWIGECPPVLLELQDALGELGDRAAALRHLEGIEGDHSAYEKRLLSEQRQIVKLVRRHWAHSRGALKEASRWRST